MLYLLLTASSNTPMFARDLPLLLFLGVTIVLVLMVLVGYQLLALRRRLQAGLFGSKLTLRLVLLFSLVAVLPGALVYSVSVQFLNKSIESWFDVRVEKALEGGLSLGRTTLDYMLRELRAKADSMAVQLADVRPPQLLAELDAMRDQAGVREATLFQADGSIIAFSISEGAGLMPSLLPVRAMQQARVHQPFSAIESLEDQALRLRVVVPVNRFSGGMGLLQLVQPVPDGLARDADTVQAIYRDYQELSLSRSGLKRLYGLSLTLSLLLALLSALALAIVFSERLSAPLVLLAAGTRAVAQGDFSQRHPVRSHDELGILTASFNTMTTQLEEARAAAMRNQQGLEGAKAYVESILEKLSAGVLSFDSERRLRSFNPSAREILGVDLEPLMGVRLERVAGARKPAGRDQRSGRAGHPCRRRPELGETDRSRRRSQGAADARLCAGRLRGRLCGGVRRHHAAAAGATLMPRGAKWRAAWRTRSRIHSPLSSSRPNAWPIGWQTSCCPRTRRCSRARPRRSSSRSLSSRAWWTPSASTRVRRKPACSRSISTPWYGRS